MKNCNRSNLCVKYMTIAVEFTDTFDVVFMSNLLAIS